MQPSVTTRVTRKSDSNPLRMRRVDRGVYQTFDSKYVARKIWLGKGWVKWAVEFEGEHLKDVLVLKDAKIVILRDRRARAAVEADRRKAERESQEPENFMDVETALGILDLDDVDFDPAEVERGENEYAERMRMDASMLVSWPSDEDNPHEPSKYVAVKPPGLRPPVRTF